MKTMRINVGTYQVRMDGVLYDIEKFPDGNWLVFIRKPNKAEAREYIFDFRTKRAVLAWIETQTYELAEYERKFALDKANRRHARA